MSTSKLAVNELLRGHGLRSTPSRRAVYLLLDKKKHLSAEQILLVLESEGEDLNLPTVYRVLADLEEAGLVARLTFSANHAVYELTGGHHDHMVCNQCGKVLEFHNELIEKEQASLAKQLGFTVMHHSHTLYGVCKECNHKATARSTDNS